MNLYYVWAKDLHYTEWIDDEIGGPSFDDGWFSAYISAETPGKAKHIGLKEACNGYDAVEYTDMKIRCVHHNTHYPPGIVQDLQWYEFRPRADYPETKPGDIVREDDEGWQIIIEECIPFERGYLVTYEAVQQPKP